MRNIQGFFDGSCEPINPGGTAKWGFVVLQDEEIIHGASGTIGTGEGMTSNVAEYHALIQCLKHLYIEHLNDFIEVFGDSKMVVNMSNGTWGKRNPHKKCPHLIPLVLECRDLLDKFDSISLEWVPREQNTLADYYSKR